MFLSLFPLFAHTILFLVLLIKYSSMYVRAQNNK